MSNYEANSDHFEYLKTADDLMDFVLNGNFDLTMKTTRPTHLSDDLDPIVVVIKAKCNWNCGDELTFVCIDNAISSVSNGVETCVNILYLEFHEGDLTVYSVTPDGDVYGTEFQQFR